MTYLTFAGSAVVLGPRAVRRPDLLYVESPPLFVGVAGRVLAWRWRCPYVVNVSDLWPDSVVEMGALRRRGLAARALSRVERWIYRGAAGATGQSSAIVAAVSARSHGLPTAVITNGVDTSRFGPNQRSAAADQTIATTSDQQVLFLYAGLLGHAQGLDQILEVAERLGDDGPARFSIIGDGPCRPELERRLMDRPIATVTLHPPVPRSEVAGLLAAADVAFITLGADLTGAVPSKIYEAMASAIPILLAASGEAAERVALAGCGLTVTPWDIDGLEDAVRRLTGDTTLRRRLGDAGRRVAEETYARDRIAKTLDDFLEARLVP